MLNASIILLSEKIVQESYNRSSFGETANYCHHLKDVFEFCLVDLKIGYGQFSLSDVFTFHCKCENC